MKKFLAMYMAPVSAQEQMGKATPAQMKAGMDDWMKWGKKHEKAIVDMGTPLGKTKKIAEAGVSDTRNEMAGYSIVQGDSLEAVSKIFVGHPHIKMTPGGRIEVVECLPMPGM